MNATPCPQCENTNIGYWTDTCSCCTSWIVGCKECGIGFSTEIDPYSEMASHLGVKDKNAHIVFWNMCRTGEYQKRERYLEREAEKRAAEAKQLREIYNLRQPVRYFDMRK